MPDPWTLEHAIEIAKIGGPYQSFDGTGGIWTKHGYGYAEATFNDWGLARATSIILNAVIAGKLTVTEAE